MVRPPVDEVVTPTPKTAWLTRWPSWNAGPASSMGSGPGGGAGERGRGGVRGTKGAGGDDAGVDDRRFGTWVCASR